jgi:hypothetical protein
MTLIFGSLKECHYDLFSMYDGIYIETPEITFNTEGLFSIRLPIQGIIYSQSDLEVHYSVACRDVAMQRPQDGRIYHGCF